MSNILYISCHSVLEYDELRLLTSLGHSIFSIGSYFDPQNPGESIRPPLKLHQDPEWRDLFYKTGCSFKRLSKEFLSRFDMIIAMHGHKFLEDNLKNVSKHTKIFWRGIGQSSPTIEQRLRLLRGRGVQLIRYSPLEAKTANYAGEDYLIRFCKDERDFKTLPESTRNGKGFMCYNGLLQRRDHNDWDMAKDFVRDNGFEIYGGSNEGISGSKGFMSYEDQLATYRAYSKVFCISSYPAPYTLGFVEAVMSGCEIFMCENGDIYDERSLDVEKRYLSDKIYSYLPGIYDNIKFGYLQGKKSWALLGAK